MTTLAGKYWTRVRTITDTMVSSDDPITPDVLGQHALNSGTAVRVMGFEGVKNVEVSFLDHHKYSVSHIHDAVDGRCTHCRNHSVDELGPDYTA